MKHARENLGVVLAKDRMIYITGGFGGSDNEYLKKCERFNFKEGVWEIIPDMTTPRAGHSLISRGRYIYAIGGFDGEHILSSVERFDI